MSCSAHPRSPCDCEAGSLAFAEAMALDPSEVEILWNDPPPQWKRLSDVPREYALIAAKIARYRRAKPKRSRVQEMFNPSQVTGSCPATWEVETATQAIRAICEWLRARPMTDRMPGCDYSYAIDREFLEPR